MEFSMAIRDTLLPEFDSEMANTRKLLERLPQNLSDYKPHEKSMTFNRLAGHVAELPGWAKETFTKEVLELDMEHFVPFEPKTRQEVLDKFDQNSKAGREALAAANDEAFAVIWSLKNTKGDTIFSMPRAVCYRGMVMQSHDPSSRAARRLLAVERNRNPRHVRPLSRRDEVLAS
jgi:DNA topoisomerase VI subunit B